MIGTVCIFVGLALTVSLVGASLIPERCPNCGSRRRGCVYHSDRFGKIVNCKRPWPKRHAIRTHR